MGRAREELERVVPILNQNPKAKEMMGALPAVVEFNLEGEEESFFVIVDGDQLSLAGTTERKPDIKVSGDADEIAKIVRREREIMHPIAEGKVWVSAGKLSQMVIFDRVLDFQRRK